MKLIETDRRLLLDVRDKLNELLRRLPCANDNDKQPAHAKETYIYAIVNDRTGFVKIGLSKDPHERRLALRYERKGHELGNTVFDSLRILGAIPGDRHLERAIHEKLADFCANGEWFHPAPEVMSWVATLSGCQ